MPIPAPPLPPGATIAPITGAIVPQSARRLSKRRFMGRLTRDEYIALTSIRLNPDTPLAIRAGLETLVELRDMSPEIELEDPDTLHGQTVSLHLLTQLPEGTPGRLAVADVDARLAAWRADFPTAAEVAAIAIERGLTP